MKFARKGNGFAFPFAPTPRVGNPSIKQELPLYITYPEMVAAAGGDLTLCEIPQKHRVLRMCRIIKFGHGDFLATRWMRSVKKAWNASLVPSAAFRNGSGNRYWWCSVKTAKGGDTHTWLILSVSPADELLAYAFYSSGGMADEDRLPTIRFHENHIEREKSYKGLRDFLSGVESMRDKEDHFVLHESKRDEFLQAAMNRDGTFCAEYQLYHMPWQMRIDKVDFRTLKRMVELYWHGGVPAIANEFRWRCVARPERRPFDIGCRLRKALADAKSRGRTELAESVRAVGVAEDADAGKYVVPLFLKGGDRPVEWHSSFAYLPKKMSKRMLARIVLYAAIRTNDSVWLHKAGEMFVRGEGVKRDVQLALYWEKRAMRMGSRSAAEAVPRLKRRVDPLFREKSAAVRADYENRISALSAKKKKGDDVDQELFDLTVGIECDLYDARLSSDDCSVISGLIHTLEDENVAEE